MSILEDHGGKRRMPELPGAYGRIADEDHRISQPPRPDGTGSQRQQPGKWGYVGVNRGKQDLTVCRT